MKFQLQLVFEINKLDLRIYECEDNLEKIPQRFAEIDAELQSTGSVLSQKTSLLTEREKVKRDKEREVEQSEARLKDLQGKLSAIKTNKEYQAAIKETSETRKSNKIIEDEILRLMTETEALKKEVQEMEGSLKAKSENYEKERRELRASEERLKTEILEVGQERRRILSQIEPRVLGQYEKIRKIRREAVSFVERGNCLGCNMRIPPQLFIEIQKLKTVHTCPSCHRILYLQEWQGEALTRLPEKEAAI